MLLFHSQSNGWLRQLPNPWGQLGFSVLLKVTLTNVKGEAEIELPTPKLMVVRIVKDILIAALYVSWLNTLLVQVDGRHHTSSKPLQASASFKWSSCWIAEWNLPPPPTTFPISKLGGQFCNMPQSHKQLTRYAEVRKSTTMLWHHQRLCGETV